MDPRFDEFVLIDHAIYANDPSSFSISHDEEHCSPRSSWVISVDDGTRVSDIINAINDHLNDHDRYG